ncbi:terpene synthase family protein [Nocardia terpenica]|uniref:terpene synthase family protein n=1 Tax=Nocardia terpenica TaxID=455432 RepID=UPI00142E8648|nr:terpene synthase family protein [Nocardia terpenica]
MKNETAPEAVIPAIREPAMQPLWCPIPTAIHPDRREFDERNAGWRARFLADSPEAEQGGADRGACHPELAQVHDAAWCWAHEQNLIPQPAIEESLMRTQPELLACLAFPDAELERVMLVSEWLMWAFVIDDRFDDGPGGLDPAECGQVIEDLIAVLDGGATHSPLEVALADLREQTCRGRSQAWLRQFRRHTADYLWSYYVQAVGYAAGHGPTMGEFLSYRCDSVAMQALLDLHELMVDIDLPERARMLPAYRALRQAVTLHSTLINDLRSYGKETTTGHVDNIMKVLEQQHHLDHTTAVEHTTDLLAKTVQQIRTAQQQLLDDHMVAALSHGARGALRQCAEDYPAIAQADHDFHDRAARYAGGTDFRAGDRSVTSSRAWEGAAKLDDSVLVILAGLPQECWL